MKNLRNKAVESGLGAIERQWPSPGVRQSLVQKAMRALRDGPAWPSPRVVSEIVVDAVIDVLAKELRAALEPEIEAKMKKLYEEKAKGWWGGLDKPDSDGGDLVP